MKDKIISYIPEEDYTQGPINSMIVDSMKLFRATAMKNSLRKTKKNSGFYTGLRSKRK